MSAVSIRPANVDVGVDRTTATTVQAELAVSDLLAKKNGKVLMTTSPTSGKVARPQLRHSFLSALYTAYSDHYRLEIRPDDVWLTIMLTFADYVDNHAEQLRKMFVQHDGKVQLLVDCGTASFSSVDWNWAVGKFSDLINQNTQPGVRDWAEPKFSTTTPTDSLIARVALMGALKNYFAYGCYTRCGFPEIVLRGTPADWMLLSSKIAKFQEIGSVTGLHDLTSWYMLLNRVVAKFAAAVTVGEVDRDFWMSAIDRSSGSGKDTISGWSLVFTPFKKGQWNLRPLNNIATGWHFGDIETSELVNARSVEVPVKFNDNGTMHDVYLCAGAYVNAFEPATGTIRASFDFALVEVPTGTIQDVFDWRDPRVKPISAPRVAEVTSFEVMPQPRLSRNAMRPERNQPVVATPELVDQVLAAQMRNMAMAVRARQLMSFPRTADVRGLHSHTLSYTNHTLSLMVACNMCMGRGFAVSYRCDGCDYDLCIDCFTLNYNPQPVTIDPHIVGNPANPPGPAPGYDVYGLPRVAPAEAVIIRSLHPDPLIRMTFANGHTCDVCRTTPIMKGWRCPGCDFDVCHQCMTRQVSE